MRVDFIVIQLSRVKERVENVDRLEEKLGEEIHRMEAVDVLSDRWATFPYCSSFARQRGGRSLKAAEIACSASHIEALRHAAVSGADATVVFEDDASLKPGTDAALIRERLRGLPPSAEILTTVRQENGNPEPHGDRAGWLRPYRRLPWGTSSSVIFPRTYARLEPHLLPISMPIDVFYDWAVRQGHIRAFGPADPENYWTHNGPFRSQTHVER